MAAPFKGERMAAPADEKFFLVLLGNLEGLEPLGNLE